MTDKEYIVEGNRLIQLFLIQGTVSDEEYEMRSLKLLRHFEGLQFHSSWDSIIPVIHKIKELPMIKGKVIQQANLYGNIEEALMTINLHSVWFATIQFIQWHNTLNPLTETKQ